MPTVISHNRKFDARPDRIDYRDRRYMPPLVSLPDRFPDEQLIKKYLPDYTKKGLILDQAQEGACTGFGLAAVINYLLWKKAPDSTAKVKKISPRMIYQMARIYDEWPGEDYEGSSCRGAMKGWHRHGICTDDYWPYDAGQFIKPKEGWQSNAALRPLGAYYRVNKNSIADMQAAIHEVGAVYVSATVHEGWFLKAANTLPTIKFSSKQTGGHAFAMVGYRPDGFIVQNSWGNDWGYIGFAIMTYEDWIQSGADAWVAVLGAPMRVDISTRTRSSVTLRDMADGKATWFWSSDTVEKKFEYENKAVQPIDENDAYQLTLVLGNNGRPLNRFLDVENATEAVKEVAFTRPGKWLATRDKPKLAIYAHGGLNDEDASIKRIRVMAPYFIENQIYPLFLTWRTGVVESVVGMVQDVVEEFFTPKGVEPAWGWISDLKDQLAEARDRSIEVAVEEVLVKAVWGQMKQNAAAAGDEDGGLSLIAGHLDGLKKTIPKLEIHLIGHSAGSMLLGHLLDKFNGNGLKISTLTLFAPACTVNFALRYYVKAVNNKLLDLKQMYFDVLSDERERADSVGPYGKSLLYLVSRALEDVHKMPILGMEGAWQDLTARPDIWHGSRLKGVKEWKKFAKGKANLQIHDKTRASVPDGQGEIPLAHGSFDNDVDVMTKTLERVRGAELRAKIESLRGF